MLDAAVRYPPGASHPVTTLAPDDLAAHRRRYGERWREPRLLDTIEYLGLDGRGGGRFPVAAKWRAQLAAGGGGVVVANGAESEPASAKDAALLQLRPHLVLDGLAAAAEAVGAFTTVVWVHAGALASRAALARAVAERRRAGLAEPPVQLVVGPRRYLSGESSAIVRALSGGPALPEFRRVPATNRGIGGRPTLVHNVETLARIGVAARAERGPPTTLLTIATAAGRTVVEVPSATPLWQVHAVRHVQAVLVGGFGGTWMNAPAFGHVHAGSLPLRLLLPLLDDGCGIGHTAAIADYLAASSAGQCGPCRFGLRAVADLLADLVELRARRRDTRRLHRALAEIAGRGACHHPDGAVRMVASALRTFAVDVRAHLYGSSCRHSGEGGFFPVPEAP
jgi:NADH:ubiquinone oxidoreductase subunit F (NADH-binding)